MNTPVWHDGADLGLEPLDGDVRADVCVVGLGGSGLSAVSRLLEAGLDVVGLDAGAVAGGAAGRNGGFLLGGVAAFHHDAVTALGRERATALYRATLDELERVVQTTPGCVRSTGSLRVADSAAERADCEAQRRQMLADGLPVEPYRGPEGEGLLFPRDAAFDPLARCRELAMRAVAGGARLHERSAVTVVSAGRVATAAGTVTCGRVIVAVDGGLDRLLPELAGSVRTARLQMLATAPTREVVLPRPVYRRYGYEYYQQLPDGRIALGGFRDRGGDAEWTHDATPTRPVQDRLEAFLRDALGVREAPVTHRWAASVGYTPGVLPHFVIVRGGVVACGGYNGTGNLVGALLGRAAADVVLTGRSEVAELFTGSATLEA